MIELDTGVPPVIIIRQLRRPRKLSRNDPSPSRALRRGTGQRGGTPPLCIPSRLSAGGFAAGAVLRPQGARSGGASAGPVVHGTSPGALPRTPGYLAKREATKADSSLPKYPGGSGAAAGGSAPPCDRMAGADLRSFLPGPC
jgi:hypothetical protein